MAMILRRTECTVGPVGSLWHKKQSTKPGRGSSREGRQNDNENKKDLFDDNGARRADDDIDEVEITVAHLFDGQFVEITTQRRNDLWSWFYIFNQRIFVQSLKPQWIFVVGRNGSHFCHSSKILTTEKPLVVCHSYYYCSFVDYRYFCLSNNAWIFFKVQWI